MNNFLSNNGIFHHLLAWNKSRLEWRDKFIQIWRNPSHNNLCYDFIHRITEADRSKVPNSFWTLNLQNESNVSLVEGHWNSFLCEDFLNLFCNKAAHQRLELLEKTRVKAIGS